MVSGIRAAISWIMGMLGMVMPSLEKAPPIPRDPRWDKESREFLKEHNECAYCGRKSNLQVHHIFPVSKFRHLEMDQTLWVVLCEPPGEVGCHLREGHLGHFAKGYNVSIREDCDRHRKRIVLRETGGVE